MYLPENRREVERPKPRPNALSCNVNESKTYCVDLPPRLHASTKLNENQADSFSVILLTVRQTNCAKNMTSLAEVIMSHLAHGGMSKLNVQSHCSSLFYLAMFSLATMSHTYTYTYTYTYTNTHTLTHTHTSAHTHTRSLLMRICQACAG